MPLPDVLRALLDGSRPVRATRARRRRSGARPRDGFAEVSGDVLGSSVARVKGTGDGPLLAVVGHIDEIGLVDRRTSTTTASCASASVGGWDPQILVGQRVELVTREGRVPGVVGKKPIHLLKEDERKKVPKIKDLHIDIGAKDGDEARALGAASATSR